MNTLTKLAIIFDSAAVEFLKYSLRRNQEKDVVYLKNNDTGTLVFVTNKFIDDEKAQRISQKIYDMLNEVTE